MDRWQFNHTEYLQQLRGRGCRRRPYEDQRLRQTDDQGREVDQIVKEGGQMLSEAITQEKIDIESGGIESVFSTQYPMSAAATAVITLAFSTDPVARWTYPDPDQYLEHFPAFVRAFAGKAFASGTAYLAPDAAGAALWLGPGVE